MHDVFDTLPLLVSALPSIVTLTNVDVCAAGKPHNDFSAMESKFEYEYLVKFKSLSYLHVQWLSAHEIGKRTFLARPPHVDNLITFFFPCSLSQKQ